MKNYKMYGRTQIDLDEFQGMTMEQLQKQFHYLPEKIVKMISDDVSPKEAKSSKKRIQSDN